MNTIFDCPERFTVLLTSRRAKGGIGTKFTVIDSLEFAESLRLGAPNYSHFRQATLVVENTVGTVPKLLHSMGLSDFRNIFGDKFIFQNPEVSKQYVSESILEKHL